jgi:uncharacterized protein with FMN-binding domain
MFLPKRGVIAGILTAGALVLLLSFRTPDAPVLSDASGGAAIAGTGPAATPAASGGIAGATAQPATTLPPAASDAPPPATPAPAAQAPAATEAPTAARPTPAAASDGTVVGDAIRIRWGYVQVQVTIANGAITDVTTLQIPMGDPRSAQINSNAEPYLRESALQSQSAAIDYVSGATFTSQAYARSLQSALDRVGIQG